MHHRGGKHRPTVMHKQAGSPSPDIYGATASIGRLMALAVEMHAPLHDALETHEGAKA